MGDARNRHAQRKAATHQGLIDAARAVIVEKGYSNVEILDITERANFSKATFYKHFPNKEDCVRELMEQGFDALAAEALGEMQDMPDVGEWIVHSLTSVFNWADANREFMLIMVGGAASTRLNAFGRNYMVQVVERAIFTKFSHVPRRFPSKPAAQAITGMVIQMLGWWLEQDTGYTAQEMAQMLYTIISRGMGPLTVEEAMADDL